MYRTLNLHPSLSKVGKIYVDPMAMIIGPCANVGAVLIASLMDLIEVDLILHPSLVL